MLSGEEYIGLIMCKKTRALGRCLQLPLMNPQTPPKVARPPCLKFTGLSRSAYSNYSPPVWMAQLQILPTFCLDLRPGATSLCPKPLCRILVSNYSKQELVKQCCMASRGAIAFV